MPDAIFRSRYPFLICMVSAVLACSSSPVGAQVENCGRPATGDGGDGGPLASDCLFILRSAVGQFPCEPICICDVNGGGLAASDALLCLRKAVGQQVELTCECTACELVPNGDFEIPVVAEPQADWEFANVDGAGGWRSSDGNPDGFFRLNQAGQVDTDPMILQDLEGLVMGATYRISGDYRSFAPQFGNPGKADAFEVQLSSVSILTLPRPSPDPLEWTRFHVDFIASATTENIAFLAERDGDDSSFDIDNICLACLDCSP